MGGKPSNNLQSDRPESGGADHNSEHENSGLLERDKEKFAIEEHEKKEAAPVKAAVPAKEAAPKGLEKPKEAEPAKVAEPAKEEAPAKEAAPAKKSAPVKPAAKKGERVKVK